MENELVLIVEILNALGILVASIVAIIGICSWRREARWKRRYELAEEVLIALYEARNAIRLIRSPFGSPSEGESRNMEEGETPAERRILNHAHSFKERYEQHKRTFEKLESLKFRFTALYKKDLEHHFGIFSEVVSDIFFAAEELADAKVANHFSEEVDLKGVFEKTKRVLYFLPSKEQDDDIEKRLKDAINEIEKPCRKIIGRI